MRYKHLKTKLYEAPEDEVDPTATTEETPVDVNTQADQDYVNSIMGADEEQSPAPTDQTDTQEPSPETQQVDSEVQQADAQSPDVILSNDNISTKEPNPIASKPYSQRVKTMISLMREFGYSSLDYQIKDGNKSVITINGNLTDQHIKDFKKFAGEIKVNSEIASSKIDQNRFITTITISNKSTLQTFKDLVSGGEIPTDTSSTNTDQSSSPESMPSEESQPTETMPPESEVPPSAEETPPPEEEATPTEEPAPAG
jgi:hypothetical protein